MAHHSKRVQSLVANLGFGVVKNNFYKKPASRSKREQFRRYLEKGGVMSSLTGVLVSLYEQPEKPSNALDFLKQQLGAAGEEMEETQALRQELAKLRDQCDVLGEENTELRARLQRYEPAPENTPAAE